MNIRFITPLIFLCSFQAASQVNSVTVFFDSRLHSVKDSQLYFPVVKYDLSLTSKIKAEIDRRLVYQGTATSVGQVEEWARKKSQSDPALKKLFESLQHSYEYLGPVAEYGISKVPAVVAHIGEDHFIVYGETDIQKALRIISTRTNVR